MFHALGESMDAMPRIASCLTEHLDLDALGVSDGFLDPSSPTSASDGIEEIHEPGAEQEPAGKTR